MKVDRDTVVTIDYRLELESGEEVDSSSESGPLTFIQGKGTVLPGLENGVSGMDQGESRHLSIPPAEGFGQRDPRAVQEVARDQFPADVELRPGMTFYVRAPTGQAIPFTVTAVRDDSIEIDMNHPLAGHTLECDITVRDVRQATDLELAHGHVHQQEGPEARP